MQPSAPITDLNIISGVGPAEAAFNEFHSLFERNQVQVTATGLAGDADGNEDTLGDEIVASIIWNKLSLSAGQFHFQTNGFRENNDQQTDLYDLFTQVAVTPDLAVQAEYRHRDTEHGDLNLDFDPDEFSEDERRDIEQGTGRVGARLTLSPRSNVIGSLAYTTRDTDLQLEESGVALDSDEEQQGYQVQVTISI